jgi:hypothetical protein
MKWDMNGCEECLESADQSHLGKELRGISHAFFVSYKLQQASSHQVSWKMQA